ncbi:RelA/SpoT domain-containing protein [Burkholderia gladioli]|nr:RelA/SpoT domain-containing protein [Burkholderia gladioli]
MVIKNEKHRILTEDKESEFLLRNRISVDEWEKSACSWPVLQEIASDHENNFSGLATTAEFVAKTIQGFSGVHSVRWRVKDTEHLIEKIIRKRSNEKTAGKYKDINKENYVKIITDLIGVRALHLFKDGWVEIHDQLMKTWTPVEDPRGYIRQGDQADFVDKLKNHGLDVQIHDDGYRSIHYVVESKLTNRSTLSEIQVRTLFEEGWSEIDHTVRYPNFQNHDLIKYLLAIFNRMAGSADEMGGFVRQLADSVRGNGDELRRAIDERDKAMSQIDDIVADLEDSKIAEKSHRELINKLKSELSLLKEVQMKKTGGSVVFGDGDGTINVVAMGADGRFILDGHGRVLKVPDFLKMKEDQLSSEYKKLTDEKFKNKKNNG